MVEFLAFIGGVVVLIWLVAAGFNAWAGWSVWKLQRDERREQERQLYEQERHQVQLHALAEQLASDISDSEARAIKFRKAGFYKIARANERKAQELRALMQKLGVPE